MMSHTPGPWKQGQNDDHWKREVRGSDGTAVAWCGCFPIETAHANAALIAAAPETAAERDRLRALNAELLEALKPFAAVYEEFQQAYIKQFDDRELGAGQFDQVRVKGMWSVDLEADNFRRARAAIAKARLAPPTETGE